MTTDSNLYSGDDEGFESSAEKVDIRGISMIMMLAR